MVYVASSYPLQFPESSKFEESIEVYFKKRNRLFIYNKPEISEYQVDEILNNNRDFNIVYGLPASGKTCVSKRLTRYGYTLIDIGDFIEKVKGIKAGPDGDKDSITVEFPMFIEEFQKELENYPKTEKLLVDNLNKIITKEEELTKFLDVTGPIRKYYNLVCDETPLIDRYKVTSGTEELSDDQKEEYISNNFTLPSTYIEIFTKRCVNKVDINTNNSESKTFEILEQLLGKKLIVLTHDYNLAIESQLYLLATTHKILYVNVPDLIRRQYVENTESVQKLKNTYSQKTLKGDTSKCTLEELVYYEYNPIHYQDKVVVDLINSYVNSNSKENEDSKNIVILSGFMNNHLLSTLEQCYNLPLFEVHQLLNLGIKVI